MVDMAQSTEELVSCLGMLRDMICDNWTGSEEMERIRESAHHDGESLLNRNRWI